MKKVMSNVFVKFGTSICALALSLATLSVQTTCLFASYQPDVPSELEK